MISVEYSVSPVQDLLGNLYAILQQRVPFTPFSTAALAVNFIPCLRAAWHAALVIDVSFDSVKNESPICMYLNGCFKLLLAGIGMPLSIFSRPGAGAAFLLLCLLVFMSYLIQGRPPAV